MTPTIIAAILASNGLFALIQFLIKRRDEKKGKMAEMAQRLANIDDRLLEQERGSCRTQMMVLMCHYPNETEQIMKLAEHYFKPKCSGGLEGDWYMTGIFNKWLTGSGIGKPEWFNSEA